MTAAQVIKEPAVYRRDRGEFSFFGDLVAASRRDLDAMERLHRHEQRVNPNAGTATQGSEFTVPKWAIDQYATPSRAGRVLGDLAMQIVLPPGVSSVHVPKETVGSETAIDEEGGAVPETDMTTADQSSNVVTIAGEADVSLQLYEQTPANPGLDAVVYTDLSRSYNAKLEAQLLAGTGTNGQLTGVTKISGRNSDIDGSAITTIQNLWPAIGKLLAGVGNNRFQPVEALLLAPRRWAWIASSVDTSQRPLASPGSSFQPSGAPSAGGVSPVNIDGTPAYQDGAITAGTTADYIVACRPSDLLLYESTPKFTVMPNPLSGTLQVRLRLHRYVAFVVRRPNAISVLTGLAQPSGF